MSSSSLTINHDEFPPLSKQIQSQNITRHERNIFKHSSELAESNNHSSNAQANNCDNANNQGSSQKTYNNAPNLKLGLQINNFTEDLNSVLREYQGVIDFVLAPIEPVRSQVSGDEFEVISDLALTCEEWTSRVAIRIGYPCVDHYDLKTIKYFDKLFRHALYLPTTKIVIDCPDSNLAILTVASTINDRLSATTSCPALKVLLHFPMNELNSDSLPSNWVTNKTNSEIDQKVTQQTFPDTSSSPKQIDLDSHWNFDFNENTKTKCSWTQWNAIRSHLIPDSRIGVCLSINQDLIENEFELERWSGEPVLMVIISTDLFVRSAYADKSLRLPGRVKEFIRTVALRNSLKTSFVISGRQDDDLPEYAHALGMFSLGNIKMNPDPLRDWNDKLQPPLQPLSSNLDSNTYTTFEMDYVKYDKYREAMCKALSDVTSKKQTNERIILMVLGAGRGPIVDSFIKAIKSLEVKHKFKIYALDKNPSSVRALKYKQKHEWIDPESRYETKIVESDMRLWKPNVKADIIATELIGSLSDNELSPECIDGVWKFSTPATISIPQEYSSYIAPICSYKLRQKLYRNINSTQNVYDQIYVVRLANFYMISEPQKLFTFEHKNLSIHPNGRVNERYISLKFKSKVDTVCHGFAGYFSADLYGSVDISTLWGHSTPNMDSWFPAFIPVEQPIEMPKNTELEVHFWRKESNSQVWYEWAITQPIRSRIHSPNGVSSGMSKYI